MAPRKRKERVQKLSATYYEEQEKRRASAEKGESLKYKHEGKYTPRVNQVNQVRL
jgi:hypothetical protein